MLRRGMIKGVAGVLATTALVSGPVSARSEGELPNGQVPVTRVHPFGSKDEPIEADKGDWITHYTGWVDGEGGDREKEDVEAWLDAVEFSAYIDGEEVENPDQYWGDVEPTTDDRFGDTWVVWWEYSTPPKKPGLHKFTLVHDYPDGFKDGDFVIEPGTKRVLNSYYKVE